MALKDRNRMLDDFWEFSIEALQAPMQEEPHRELCEFATDESQNAKLILVPRGTWKTSILSTAFPLWMVLRAWFKDGNSNYRVLIDSETRNLSGLVLKVIDNYTRTPRFQKYFGRLEPPHTPRMEAFSLSFPGGERGGIKEPNFLASGINAAKTGLHFDLISLDDLVTKENFDTLAKRERVWNHYRMMYGIINSDVSGVRTMMHVVGTRYHDDDMYGRIIKEEAKAIAEGQRPAWAMMIRAAIDDDGKLYAPGILTHEVLADKRRKMLGLFWAQYMNDPNKEAAPFKVDQLKWKSVSEFPACTRIRLTIDAAIKDEEIAHGDYNAMGVAGWDKWAKPWFYDVQLARDLTSTALVDAALDMAQRWNVEQIIVESIAQGPLEDLFRLEMARRRKYFSIYFVKVQGIKAGKLARWKRLQPFAERGGIYFAEEIPESTKLEIRDQFGRAPSRSTTTSWT